MKAKLALTGLMVATMTLAALGRAQAETEGGKWVLLEDTYLEEGYSAFGLKACPALGTTATYANVGGAWSLMGHLAVGIEAEFLLGNVQPNVAGADSLTAYQVGAFSEWRAWSTDFADAFAGLGLGWGEVGYRFDAGDGTSSYAHDSLTYVEPRISSFLHVSHRLDLGLTMGYRITRGATLEGIDDASMGGITSGIVMRGSF